MKNTLLLILTLLTATFVSAQPTIQWQKAYGGDSTDVLNDIKQTNDSGYIMIGCTYSKNGDVTSNHGGKGDVWVVKLDKAGAVSWQKNYGGSGSDAGYSIEQTHDGGYIFLATTDSKDGDITSNQGYTDVWVVKLNPTGAVSWQKTYGGSGIEGGSMSFSGPVQTGLGGMIHEVDSNGYVFVTTTGSNDGDVHIAAGQSPDNAWVVRLSAAGVITWATVLGGSFDDIGTSIEQTRDSGFIVSAIAGGIGGPSTPATGDITKEFGKEDYWLIKLNKNGGKVWQQTYGGTGIDEAYMAHQTLDGGYIVTGFTQSTDSEVKGNHGNNDLWVVKTNDTGTIVWAKCYGSTGSEMGYSIAQLRDSSYIMAGVTGPGPTSNNNGDVNGVIGLQDMWLLGMNPNGTLKWQKCIGGTKADYSYRILPTLDGGFAACGITQSTDGNATGDGFHGGYSDFWVVKLLPYKVGIEGVQNAVGNINIYPNPTNGILNIGLPPGYEDADIKLINTLGQQMPAPVAGKGLYRTVQLSNYAAGVYMVQVIGRNGAETYKVIYQQ